MNKDLTESNNRIAEIGERSSRMLAIVSTAQCDENGQYIKDKATRCQSIANAAKMDPLFESHNPRVAELVSTAWASAYADYCNTHDAPPRTELLAACHKAAENLLLLESSRTEKNQVLFSAGMLLESAGDGNVGSGGNDLTTSAGVIKLATYVAMILPVALGAQTSDACTFIPCEKERSKIFEIINIAGNTFGDLVANQQIDMTTVGSYSQMRRIDTFPVQPSGIKETYTYNVKDKEKKDAPIRPKRTVLYINRIPTAPDNGSGNLYHTIESDSAPITINATLDYSIGKVEVATSGALPDGMALDIGYELDVETDPSLIPTITHAMLDYELFPSYYYLAAEHSVQAYHDLMREFGLDLNSLSYRTLRDYLSHEVDMMRLRIMAWRCIHKTAYDISLPDTQSFDSYAALLRGKFNDISTGIINRTRITGMTGAFAGANASSIIKQLPSSMFTPAPNYRQTPHVHYIGMLFGVYRIFEVPELVCESLTTLGSEFKVNQMLCYGRGEGIAQAGFVTGDAIPAIPFVHPTNPQLRDRTTIMGSAINEIHPRRGEDFFVMLELKQEKEGALNLSSGEYIKAPAQPAEDETVVVPA